MPLARARVRVDLPAIIHLYDGRVLAGRVQNLSQSGARTLVPRPEDLPEDSEIMLSHSHNVSLQSDKPSTNQ